MLAPTLTPTILRVSRHGTILQGRLAPTRRIAHEDDEKLSWPMRIIGAAVCIAAQVFVYGLLGKVVGWW